MKTEDHTTPLHGFVKINDYTYGKMQPDPVVDKPGTIEQFLKERIAHAYKAIEFPGGMASQQYPFDEHNKDGLIGMKRAYSDVLTSLPQLVWQQPTEWIPVSAQTIPALDGDLSKRYYKDGARAVSKLFLLHAKHYEEPMTGYLYEVNDTTLQGADRLFWELIGIGDASFDEVISYTTVPSLPEPPKP